MLDLESLKVEREEGFKAWFSRFYKRKNIEKNIIIANQQGYKGYKIQIPKQNEKEILRVKDNLFMPSLQQKLPNFKLRIEDWNEYNILFKKEIYQGLIINISWE